MLSQTLEKLPPKSRSKLTHLHKLGYLSDNDLKTIVRAGDMTGEYGLLPEFAVIYATLKNQYVRVDDILNMAEQLGTKINLWWSIDRWRNEHDRMGKINTLRQLAKENETYDVSKYAEKLPEKWPGYLIKTSRRLGFEGLRQRHCVASYGYAVRSGRCAIAVVFINKTRWTVELNINAQGNLVVPQIKGYKNKAPDQKTVVKIREALGFTRPIVNIDADSNNKLFKEIATLIENGAETLEAEFYGGGDSGQLENIITYPVDVIHTIRTNAHDLYNTALLDYLDSLMDESNVSWYNDEGGDGNIKINFSYDEDTKQIKMVYDMTVNYNEMISHTGYEVEGVEVILSSTGDN